MRQRATAAAAGTALLITAPITFVPAALAAPEDAAVQHNVTYRARVDGLARGALISYRISDTQVSSVDPTMLPGRTFESTAVLSNPKEAGMRISIQWPYSANLICEILVDDLTVAAASTFISPRVIPVRDDPDYGALNCGAPLSNAMGAPMDSVAPADPLVPTGPGAPPAPGQAGVPLPGTAVNPATRPLN